MQVGQHGDGDDCGDYDDDCDCGVMSMVLPFLLHVGQDRAPDDDVGDDDAVADAGDGDG